MPIWMAPDRRRTPDKMAEDCHILVVEDDPRLRERLARYLTGEGFRVTAAGDAAEARTQLRAINPDLMVLDVMMPGESGLDLTQSLRVESSDEHADPAVDRTRRAGRPYRRVRGRGGRLSGQTRSSRANWCCASARCCGEHRRLRRWLRRPDRCGSARRNSISNAANCAMPPARSV